MALAAQLIPGFKYKVLKGMYAEEVVTIIDNTPFPDGDSQNRQRKITVMGPDSKPMYILPRLLDEKPVGMEGETITAPVFVTAPEMADLQKVAEVPTVEPSDNAGWAAVYQPNPITDPMDPRLDHLRPSRAKVKRYISREMVNGMTDVEWALTFVSDFYREGNQGWPANLALNGDTSSGKTFFVEALAVAWADALGYPKPIAIFTLSGSAGVTDYDLFGQTVPYVDPTTGKEMLIMLPGIPDLAARVNGPVILFLDEMNAFGERVTTTLHPLLDHRHQFINRYKPVWRNGQFMPDVVVANQDMWAIGNYNEGYVGMSVMNQAFKNRFDIMLWDYDSEVEKKLIKSDAIRLLGSKLRTARQAKRSMTPTGTALLQRLERSIQAFGIAVGMSMFLAHFQAHERSDVEAIIEDGSIYVLLQEEQRQAKFNERSSD